MGKLVRIDVQESGAGQDTTAPTKPTNFAVTKTNGQPKLTWNASSDAVGVAGYSVLRSTDGTAGPEIALTTSLTWTDSSAVEGTRYTYAVRAYDAAGNLSPHSTLKSITPFQNPTKPGSFKVVLSNGKPKLTFNASTDNVGVVGYNVYRSTNGSMGSLYAQIAGSPWVDTSAQKGVTYTYAVRAGTLPATSAPPQHSSRSPRNDAASGRDGHFFGTLSRGRRLPRGPMGRTCPACRCSCRDRGLRAHGRGGQAVPPQRLRERGTLVFFGFTHWPGVCPATMFRLKEFLKRQKRGAVVPTIVMISVDGERDSPAAMMSYLEPLSSAFIGLTGDPGTSGGSPKDFQLFSSGVCPATDRATTRSSTRAKSTCSTAKAACARRSSTLPSTRWRRRSVEFSRNRSEGLTAD